MQTNLSITALDSTGKKITTNITYVNNNATNQQLAELASKLNNFTNNTYATAYKETKEEL